MSTIERIDDQAELRRHSLACPHWTWLAAGDVVLQPDGATAVFDDEVSYKAPSLGTAVLVLRLICDGHTVMLCCRNKRRRDAVVARARDRGWQAEPLPDVDLRH